jgi:hypothetical protein
MLRALEMHTLSMGDDKFDYPDIAFKTKEDDIPAAANLAERWYFSHRNDLPEHTDKADAEKSLAAKHKGSQKGTGSQERRKARPSGTKVRRGR